MEVSEDKYIAEDLSSGEEVNDFLDKVDAKDSESTDSEVTVDEDIYESKVLITALKAREGIPLTKDKEIRQGKNVD